MKYVHLLACMILLCAAVACKKTDDGGTTPVNTPGKTWKLGATTYTVNNYAKFSTEFQVYDKTGSGMIFTFPAFPTADGNYNVVGSSATLGPNDVQVVAFGSTSGTSYFATGEDHTVAAVKVISATVLAIKLPDTWVVKGGTDSLKLSTDIGSL